MTRTLLLLGLFMSAAAALVILLAHAYATSDAQHAYATSDARAAVVAQIGLAALAVGLILGATFDTRRPASPAPKPPQ